MHSPRAFLRHQFDEGGRHSNTRSHTICLSFLQESRDHQTTQQQTFCGATFASHMALTSHIRIAHAGRSFIDVLIVCNICFAGLFLLPERSKIPCTALNQTRALLSKQNTLHGADCSAHSRVPVLQSQGHEERDCGLLRASRFPLDGPTPCSGRHPPARL